MTSKHMTHDEVSQRNATIQAAVIHGQATRSIAAEFGLSCLEVREILRIDSEAWAAYRAQRPRGKSEQMRERNTAIRKAVIEDGRTLQSVADDYDVSRQRVFQIIRRDADSWQAYQEQRKARMRDGPSPGHPVEVFCLECGIPLKRTRASAHGKYCSATCATAPMVRARRGYEMRCSGMGWREIAETLGLPTKARGRYNLGHVCSVVKRYAVRNKLPWPVTQQGHAAGSSRGDAPGFAGHNPR